jgi:hypothetical protein
MGIFWYLLHIKQCSWELFSKINKLVDHVSRKKNKNYNTLIRNFSLVLYICRERERERALKAC